MTVGEIKTYVSYLVDDLEFGYFTSAQLNRFINQAQLEVQKKLIRAGWTWYLKIDESLTTVVNQSDYSLPSDFLEINKLEYVKNAGVNESKIVLNSIDALSESSFFAQYNGQSQAFYLKKDKLVLLPKPNIAGDTLRIYYSYRIADISADGDTPDIPKEYHEYLAHLVAIKCFIKDGRDYTLLTGVTKEIEKDLEAAAASRLQDKPRMIVLTGDTLGTPY